VISFRSVAASEINGTFSSASPFPVAMPAGAAVNDFLLMSVGSDNHADWVIPSGWTQLYADDMIADSASFRLFYRIATGTEGSVVNVSATGTPSVNVAAWIAAWSGVLISAPINAQSHNGQYQQTDATLTKTVTATGITTSVNNAVLVWVGWIDQNTTSAMTFAVPSGMTTRVAQQGGSSWVTHAMGDETQITAGATGTLSAIWSNGAFNSSISASISATLLALTPAAGGGAVVSAGLGDFTNPWVNPQGINFRNTLAYVTDPTGTVGFPGRGAGQNNLLPYPYSVSPNGATFNCGWDANVNNEDGARDRVVNTGVAAELSGINAVTATGSPVGIRAFSIELPSAGTYLIWLALGDGAGGYTSTFAGGSGCGIYDGGTVGSAYNSGGEKLLRSLEYGTTTSSTWFDAAGNLLNQSQWTASNGGTGGGTPIACTFATTVCKLVLGNINGSGGGAVAHLRIQQVSSILITRLTNAGTLLTNGIFDEVALSNLTGKGSIALNSLSSQSLTLASNSAFAFGTADFTIEVWIYPIYDVTSGIIAIYGNGNGSVANPYFNITSGIITLFYNNVTIASGPAITISSNVWTHVAAVRKSGTITLYTNGIAGTPVSASTSLTNGGVSIGASSLSSQYFPGYITNLRVVNGTAVYTSSFLPPTSPLTAITNTVLLLDVSSAGTYLTDSSAYNWTLTPTNSPTYVQLNPFMAVGVGGSIGFNANQYLTIASNAAFAFGTSDFTIEAWIFFNSQNSSGDGIYAIYGNGNGSVANPYFAYNWSPYGTIFLLYNNSYIALGPATPIPLYTWTHVAAVRKSGTITLYINGVGGTPVSASTSLTSAGVSIGASSTPAEYLPGSLTNLRVVNGTAVYTSNFSPPTSQLTAITNTVLLLNASSAGTYLTDSSAYNWTLTPTNSPVYSSLTPFIPAERYSVIGGSLSFNGSNQYLSASNPSGWLTSGGNWTVEAWIYLTGYSANYNNAYGGMVASTTITTNGDGWGLNIIGTASSWTGIDVETSGGISKVSATYSFSLNTWYHVAAVCVSGTVSLYVNGVSQTVTGNPFSFIEQTLLNVGREQDSNYYYYFPGYITNLRIVNGTAVYTSNFTPPTSPLPAITNTQLLLDVASPAAYITDPNNVLLTNHNNVTYNTLSPYLSTAAGYLVSGILDEVNLQGGSLSFNGTNQNLTLPATFTNATSTTPFTWEVWVYPTANYAGGAIFSGTYSTSGTIIPFALGGFQGDNSTINFGYYSGSAWVGTNSGVTLPLNQWSHVAAVFNGTVLTLYVNGSSIATLTTSWTTTSGTSPFLIGRRWDTGGSSIFFSGYITNLRYVAGTAVYTSNFTPPTQPLTAITNTQLLLDVVTSSAYITDSSTNNFTLTNVNIVTYNSLTPFPQKRITSTGNCLITGIFDEVTGIS